MKRIPVNVDGEDHARLARLSKRTGVPASVMVRRAVREWIEQNEARMLDHPK